jgi:predicted ATPase
VRYRTLKCVRLLTLTGPGGCGKTRLALQAAADMVATFTDGAWWVELAALADESLLPQTVARALALKEQPGRPPLETLANQLRPRQQLLILDNCEHLVAACTALADTLLRACPHLQIFATSREALRTAARSSQALRRWLSHDTWRSMRTVGCWWPTASTIGCWATTSPRRSASRWR